MAEGEGMILNDERGRRRAEGRFAARLRRCATNHQSPITHHAVVVAVLTATLALAGCDYLPFGYTSVKEITAAPASFEGKEVKVKGKVKGSLTLLGMKAFVLRDDTGEIAVSTAGELPAVGSDAAVRGTVRSSAIIVGASIGLRVEETKRLR
jgi:hypothetical protein